jgi:hypothetical protein
MNGGALESDIQREHSLHFGRKALFFEVCVFLFLIVPSMALSFFAIDNWNGSMMPGLTKINNVG